jgi:radical SAM superfamily enzyme YgiQ (UPF0313 family)
VLNASGSPPGVRIIRSAPLRLLLINPSNPLVSLANTKASRWNRYRVWKPLGLLTIAGLTPSEWQVSIVDENIRIPDYDQEPKPDLVGITAFTSQAPRAYMLAAEFRRRGIPVVMGGIHATVCPDEALGHVDVLVQGEAESVWAKVLSDFQAGTLQKKYVGTRDSLSETRMARHDLAGKNYAFGAIQTTRGCPLDCSFCSVSTISGKIYRNRPIEQVIAELKTVRERWVLVVDDNLIGTSVVHIKRAKELFRAIIAAKIKKRWIAQVTINMADDEELLELAVQAGCRGVFIGFESGTPEGLAEIGKKFNMAKNRDFRASVKRIQRHKIMVMGSFIMGLDSDTPGIGERIALTARKYGVDILNVLFLTPLPGTRLWKQMEEEGRIAANHFPSDWQFYTLGFPTAHYHGFSWKSILEEMNACDRRFYGRRSIAWRLLRNLWSRRQVFRCMVANLSYRNNARLTQVSYGQLDLNRSVEPGTKTIVRRADAVDTIQEP